MEQAATAERAPTNRKQQTMLDFEPLREDFLRFTTDIVYCTVTTVDPKGRPRSRVMHPIFEVVDGVPQGWALTDRTPLKDRHLAANPHVACLYWSPAQNTVAIDCTAEWVTDESVLLESVGHLRRARAAGLGRPRPATVTRESTTRASTSCGCCRTGSRSCGANSSRSETSPRGAGNGD